MTSSLTTATMRSSCVTAACAGKSADAATIRSARAHCGRHQSGRRRNFIGRPVSGNTMFQNLERVGADASHPVQFELEEERIGGLVRLGRQALHHRAQYPASAIVF